MTIADENLEKFRLATAQLEADNERLEAKLKRLKRERDKLKAELAAAKIHKPRKIET